MTPNPPYSPPDAKGLSCHPDPRPTPPLRRAVQLAALPTAPRLARTLVGYVGSAAQISESCTQTAQLLVSELVTNAARATGRVEGPPTPLPGEYVAALILLVRAEDDILRLEVWDADPKPPVVEQAEAMDEGGRGLFLVEALAAAWGFYAPGGAGTYGKIVWAEVAA